MKAALNASSTFPPSRRASRKALSPSLSSLNVSSTIRLKPPELGSRKAASSERNAPSSIIKSSSIEPPERSNSSPRACSSVFPSPTASSRDSRRRPTLFSRTACSALKAASLGSTPSSIASSKAASATSLSSSWFLTITASLSRTSSSKVSWSVTPSLASSARPSRSPSPNSFSGSGRERPASSP